MDPHRAIGWAALFGLMVGGWLAFIVYQLPLQLAYDWKNHARAQRRSPLLESKRPSLWPGWGACLGFCLGSCLWVRFSLRFWPHWGSGLWPHSWWLMKKKREACSSRLGRLSLGLFWDAPYIMVATALLFAACAWRWGPTLCALSVMGLSAALVMLAWIDARTGLLPDVITLPLLWLGLVLNGLPTPILTSPRLAIWGAVVGYLCLWGLYHGFLWMTRREGMGYGDFKLLAAIGAWLGVEAVPGVLLLACLASLSMSVWRIGCGQVGRYQSQPFGPYLALAAMMVLLSR